MTLRSTTFKASVVVASLWIVACGSDTGGFSASPDSATEMAEATSALTAPAELGGVDGPVIFAAPRESGEESVLEGAELALVDDCLGLGSSADFIAVVWAYGSIWDAATSSLVANDGTSFALGEEIDLSGSFSSKPYPGSLSAEALSALDRCAALAGGRVWGGWIASAASVEDPDE